MNFSNKKIAIFGGGLEGLSTINYLKNKQADIHLFDKKSSLDFSERLLQDFTKQKITLHLNGSDLNLLSTFDIIFRSPSVRPDHPELLKAKQASVIITSQTNLFFTDCPGFIIGITGTKGKGTTSTLLYNILRRAKKRTFLGGNIGNPSLSFIGQVKKDDFVVLELSSFQLMDIEKSPDLAVVLMVTKEHQDWHRSEEEYIESKTNLVRFQTRDNKLIINADFQKSKSIGKESAGQKFYFSTSEDESMNAFVKGDFIVINIGGKKSSLSLKNIKLLGIHNIQNIAAATLASKILGIDDNIISTEIDNFKGLEHRLEIVREFKGLLFVNDSSSTTPETAVSAIKSFNNPKILILGGSKKNSDFAELGSEILKNNVKIIYLIGDEADAIENAIKKAGFFQGKVVRNLKNFDTIVNDCLKQGSPSDVVLLSPGCASFGDFKNYQDRGNQFKEAVLNLS